MSFPYIPLASFFFIFLGLLSYLGQDRFLDLCLALGPQLGMMIIQ